jgi:hypothetical protein
MADEAHQKSFLHSLKIYRPILKMGLPFENSKLRFNMIAFIFLFFPIATMPITIMIEELP